MKVAVLVTAVVAAAMGFSFRESVAGTPAMWLGLIIPYVALAGLALYRLRDDGTLSGVLRPRAGDITIGFVIAALLFGGAWAVRHVALGNGSPKIIWLFRIALSLGGARPSPSLLLLVVGMAILEELTWRGLVLGALTASLGTRRAWPAAAAFYAAAHAPTVFALADPVAGPNPLLVLSALGAGIVWAFAASIIGRLPPVIVSHAVFSYFAIAVLLPRFG